MYFPEEWKLWMQVANKNNIIVNTCTIVREASSRMIISNVFYSKRGRNQLAGHPKVAGPKDNKPLASNRKHFMKGRQRDEPILTWELVQCSRQTWVRMLRKPKPQKPASNVVNTTLATGLENEWRWGCSHEVTLAFPNFWLAVVCQHNWRSSTATKFAHQRQKQLRKSCQLLLAAGMTKFTFSKLFFACCLVYRRVTFIQVCCTNSCWKNNNTYVSDEFFQSQEVMVEDIFGFQVFRPWEFSELSAARTVSVPWVFFFFSCVNNLISSPSDVFSVGFRFYYAAKIALVQLIERMPAWCFQFCC